MSFSFTFDSITGQDKLAILRSEWADRRFSKITNKDSSAKSKIVALFLRYLRKILNPRDTYETIFHGKQLGRFS